MNWWSFRKDATASGVHVATAIGNERDRKKKEFDQELADESRSYHQADGKPLKDNGDDIVKFDKASVIKVDADLGLVFGFAIVCKVDGKDYFDLQDDNIPEASMLTAATDFMLHSRMSKDMHDGDQDGSVVFAFPLTTDIAKALDIETKQTGLLIAMKPSAAVLKKFRDGTYTGFSIGGERLKDETVA